jgi:predicted RNA polymerase sigma factor
MLAPDCTRQSRTLARWSGRQRPPPPRGRSRARSHRPSGSGTDSPCAGRDDTLTLLFLCCHPALSPPSQLALTLRAVGGLTTAEIAAAFLAPEATTAKRISRAKQRIRQAGGPVRAAEGAGAYRTARGDPARALPPLNEGYTASSGPALLRADLTAEAIRLTRLLRRLLPGQCEAAGLLALMLLTDARRAARTGPTSGPSRWPSRTGTCGTPPRSSRARPS